MDLTPIYLKIGTRVSGDYDGYYLDTVVEGDAQAKILPGTTQLHSRLASSTKRSLETH